jgi:hypothetical protein
MPTSSGTFLRTQAVMLEMLGSPMNAQRTGKLCAQQQQHQEVGSSKSVE